MNFYAMKKWILLATLACCLTSLFGQEPAKPAKGVKLFGKVLDSATRNPIEYATISLYLGGASKAVNGTTTNGQGQFTVPDLLPGTYRLVIESIGYSPKKFEGILATKGSPINLNVVLLSKRQATLETVTVFAPKGLVENKIDKIIFNAEKDLTSQTGVATDILKKVPMVSVDVDGNVELAGSSSIKFLINGKPSTAFGANITDVLQSIPASQIKSIEVITNPGAKYDAEGLGGIINIILKSNKASGINGNISLTAGTRNENGSFNINARKGEFAVNAFASGNFRLPANTLTTSDRLSTDPVGKTNTSLLQDGSSRFNRHGYQSGLGFDWTVKKKNNFSGSLSYSNFGNNSTGTIDQSQITSDQNNPVNVISTLQSINHNVSAFQFHNVDANLHYKRNFAKEDQELEFDVNTSYGNNHITANSDQQAPPKDSVFFGTQSTSQGKERETEIRLDYTQPFKGDVKAGMGGKLTLRDIHSNSDVYGFQPASQLYLYDSALSNFLHYQQQVIAAYAEVTFPVGHLFNAKLGGRYERTDLNSYFSNAPNQAVTPGYNTFVPSIFLSKKIGANSTIKLNFSKRIERPDYRNLNPFINTTDPKNVTAGNPYLRPEIGLRYEISFSHEFEKSGMLMLTAFYRTSNDDIQPYIVYYPTLKIGDSTYQNIAVSTQQNIGLEKDLGLSIFSDLHLNSKLNIRTNIFLFHRQTINAIDSGLNSTSFNYRFNINLSYQFKHNLAAEFFGNFSSPRNELQGRYPSFTSYSLAFRKQIWNKKGSIALTAQNIFSEYVNQRTILYGPNFSVNSLRQVPFRSVGINFTWKFGKLQFKKERDEPRDNGGGGPPEG